MLHFPTTVDLLSCIVNHTEDGIAYYSAVRNDNGKIIDFRFEYLNESTVKHLLETKEELIGHTLLHKFPENIDNGFFNALCSVCETGNSIEDTFRYEGGKYHAWFKNIIVKYEDGVIAFFRDVTEKKKLRLEVQNKASELQEMNARLQRLVEDKDNFFVKILNRALDGVFYIVPIWDDKKTIIDFKTVFINEQAASYIKRSVKEFYSKTFMQNFPNAKENSTFQMYVHLYHTGEFKKTVVPYNDDIVKGWYSVEAFKYNEGVIVYFRDETLTLQNQKLIEEQNEELKNLLREKEILLQETHHRVKNNLQIIASLLNLQAQTIKDPQALEAFSISTQRIQTMAAIHEKLYRDKNFKKMDFQGFISDVITSVRSFYDSSKVVKFKYNVEDIDLEISTCISIGLILNELFSNSVKHALRDQKTGEICISSTLQENSLRIVVSDNGKGLPPDFNVDRMDTLGLSIVKMLVEQLAGKLRYRNDNGAVFEINIPMQTQ